MTGLGDFIALLGDGPSVDDDDSPTLADTVDDLVEDGNEAAENANKEVKEATTCECRSGPGTAETSSAALAAILALGLVGARRQRRRG